jgi:hypothetical protein
LLFRSRSASDCFSQTRGSRSADSNPIVGAIRDKKSAGLIGGDSGRIIKSRRRPSSIRIAGSAGRPGDGGHLAFTSDSADRLIGSVGHKQVIVVVDCHSGGIVETSRPPIAVCKARQSTGPGERSHNSIAGHMSDTVVGGISDINVAQIIDR